MDKCVSDITLSKEAAIEGILKRCAFKPATEYIPAGEACGRVLAGDVLSLNILPNILTSQLDGIAVHFADFENGMPDTSRWKDGKEYVFANTGVGIAGDYDTVIRIESVDFPESGGLLLRNKPPKGQFTAPRGSRLKEGELLAKSGTVLTPMLLSHITWGGHKFVSVLKKPVVSFLPTGNELVPAGEPLPLGKNVECNSVMVYSKLIQWGAEPVIYPVIPDHRERLRDALRDALAKSDIVIINAGSSMGKDDYTVEVLEKLGTILNHQVEYGPGKHTSYTIANNGVPIVGISGPPLGAEFTSDWYIKPLIDRYLRQDEKPPVVQARLAVAVETGRIGPIVARVLVERDGEDRYIITPQPFNMVLTGGSLDKYNGFVLMPPTMHKGDIMEVELRYPYRFF